MEHKSVKSSNISSVGYDKEKKKLEIKFAGGGTYCYEDVPTDVFDSLMSVSSVGSFVHKTIKPGYKCSKI